MRQLADDGILDPKHAGESRAAVRQVAIGSILRRAAARLPTKVAVVEDDRTVTFGELNARANQVANYLRSLGLPRGARISTLCCNSTEQLYFIFGIHKAGLVWLPINIALGTEEVEYILTHAEASLALVDAHLLEDEGRRAMLSRVGVSVVVNGSPHRDGETSLAAAIASQPAEEPALPFADRELAMIMYTSGTTSRPKGVMHCHEAIVTAAHSNIGELSVTRDDCVLVFLPMFHIAAHCLCMTFLAAGAKVVIQNGFDAGQALQAVARERVSFLVGLPMMFEAMLNHPDRPSTDLSSLRVCNYAMAPMGKTLLERLIGELCPTFLLTSGQTEAYPHTVIFRPEEQLRRFGNYWGQGTLVNDVAVMAEDGALLGPMQVGEIVYRGPNMMLGYYKDPEATEQASTYGWHHSGDLGMFDADGQLLFVDRKKDMIKSGGENVASVKVEEVLLRHAAVASAAVIGVPHPRWQEAVLACVELHPSAKTSAIELINHCKTLLGAFEVPKAIVFVGTMPRTATSKLRKVELRKHHLTYFTKSGAEFGEADAEHVRA